LGFLKYFSSELIIFRYYFDSFNALILKANKKTYYFFIFLFKKYFTLQYQTHVGFEFEGEVFGVTWQKSKATTKLMYNMFWCSVTSY
jgi:hypothetical protein